ncbi:hypothetical protein GCM10026987_19520 [Belliella aquatica]|uniref:Uncharacterized protein n=1 Tax=Belliella aquatica TaxID=1323734 RepID=A0ABQ1N610_9BACT|nr:hypothetical protein GCM10010993_32890 [Belliella aquatica]
MVKLTPMDCRKNDNSKQSKVDKFKLLEKLSICGKKTCISKIEQIVEMSTKREKLKGS